MFGGGLTQQQLKVRDKARLDIMASLVHRYGGVDPLVPLNISLLQCSTGVLHIVFHNNGSNPNTNRNP